MENPLHKKRAAYWAALRFMIVGQVRRVELVGLIHRITNLGFDQFVILGIVDLME